MSIYLKTTLLILAGLFTGNRNMHGQIPQKQASQRIVCNMRMEGLELEWVKVQDARSLKLPAKAGAAKLPLNYTVYTTNAYVLKKYISALKNKPGSIVLPGPGAMSCIPFHVSNSGTMSPELAARFPGIVSLKGYDAGHNSTTLRLDYDGKRLQAEMIIDGIAYILAPWEKKTATYYLLYKKEDSGTERKPWSEGGSR